MRYLALLRGINVGGKNILPMAELRATLTDAGFADVRTYIASGNVILAAPRTPQAELAERLERLLGLKVVVLTEAQLRKVIANAPDGFGGPEHRCDVVFLRPPLTTAKVFGLFETREGVDQAWKGPGVVYFSRLTAQATKSRLGRVIALPEYKEMTIRSWRTTQRLAAMIDADA